MGARLCAHGSEQPYIDKERIERRLDAIEEINKELINQDEIREYLNPVYDLERLISKISCKTANPRDLIAFKSSLAMIPPIKYIMKNYSCQELVSIYKAMDGLEDICKLIEDSINDDPPIGLKDGGIIKDGFNEDIDKYRHAKTEGKQWLLRAGTKRAGKTGDQKPQGKI